MTLKRASYLYILIACLLPIATLAAIQDPATALKEVGVTAQLGGKIDLSLKFKDELGRTRMLSELALPDRPTVIVPAYYHCPRMCGLILSGVTALLNDIKLKLGSDFNVITVSFDEKDTPEIAAKKAAEFRSQLHPESRAALGENWHFLVGDKENINKLMLSLGFRFMPDGEEFAHTAAIFIVTPNGILSQYYAGISFNPNDVRYGLVEASKGAIGSALDQVFLFCFAYDHLAGKYVWIAFDIMRAGGFLTLSFLVFLFYRMRAYEKRRRVGELPI